MRMMLYLFISVAVVARAALLFVFYKTKHHRKDDLYMAIFLVMMAASYIMYSVSPVFPKLDTAEIIVDSLMGILALGTTLEAYIKALKEAKR